MPTAVTIGHGSSFEIATADSPLDFVSISEVMSISPPSDTIDVIDATSMDSANATREFILGLNDPGECSFEMNFVPGSASDDLIQSVRQAREAVTCRITFPNTVRWTFLGILTGYEPAVPFDDKMTATVTFKVTGSYAVT